MRRTFDFKRRQAQVFIQKHAAVPSHRSGHGLMPTVTEIEIPIAMKHIV